MEQLKIIILPYELPNGMVCSILINYCFIMCTGNLKDIVERVIFELDYSQFSVGEVNTTIGWIYNSSTCVPAVFTLEGYDLEDIIEDELDTPGLALNSTSNRVRLPSRSLIDMFNGSSSVYIRLGAYDELGRTCTQDSEIMFYQLNNSELS